MHRAVVFLCLAIVGATAFSIKPMQVRQVLSGTSGYAWKPKGGIAFNSQVAAVRISTSRSGCEEDNSCKHVTAFTADGGDSFHISTTATEFCGTGGVMKDEKLHCVGSVVEGGTDGVRTYTQYQYSVVPGEGEGAAPTLHQTELTERVNFQHDGYEVESMEFGHHVARFDDENDAVKELFRTVNLKLVNGSDLHMLYRAQVDADDIWSPVSAIPLPFGTESSVHRWGANKLLVTAGSEGNFTQITSGSKGQKWSEKKQYYDVPISAQTGEFRTSLLGGIRSRPGIYVGVMGAKKGSERFIDVAHHHNRLNAKQDGPFSNYSSEFLNTTTFNCSDDPGHDSCESSSYVNLIQLSPNEYLTIYDRLADGFQEATQDAPHEVYATKLYLNETKEQKEHEEKLKRQEKRREEELKRAEARAKAEKEAEERKKKERREKIKREKERRATYAKMDEEYRELAREDNEKDGDDIVVRDTTAEWADLERDFY